jgi:hypothetical protein
MRTKYLIVAGAVAVLAAAGGTGIALAGTSVPTAAVPAAAQGVDTPEPGDTPDAPQQGPDTPEPGDTPDAPGQG